MLTDAHKQSIQTAYKTLISNKGYRPRYGQRLMIAEIAKMLGGILTDAKGLRLGESHVCVVEAGTGTGKTLLAIAAGGYFPGLVSSPFIGVAGVWLYLRLRGATRSRGAGG